MTASLGSVMSELFSAPLEAVVEAEEQYRRIWAKWLDKKIELLGSKIMFEPGDTEEVKADKTRLAKEMLAVAPAVSLEAKIDTSVTMRIATTRKLDAGATLGLSAGPIQLSGSFGFMNQTATDSIFKAATAVTLSNTGKDLSGFLKENGLDPASPNLLNDAKSILNPKPN